jgi:hypothetical protein
MAELTLAMQPSGAGMEPGETGQASVVFDNTYNPVQHVRRWFGLSETDNPAHRTEAANASTMNALKVKRHTGNEEYNWRAGSSL